MISRLVFPIEGLKVENLSRPFSYSLMPLINGLGEIEKTLAENFVNDDVVGYFGVGAINRLAVKPFFIMVIKASPNQIDTILPFLEKTFFTEVEVFLDSLWFIKDNACHSFTCYNAIHEERMFGIIYNYRTATNCTGGNDVVTFTSEELERALEINKKLESNIRSEMDESVLKKIIESNFTQGIENNQNYNIGDRIYRAYYFLKAARNTYFIVMKLSLYMNIYECLFTTDTNEIIHKMAERTACYYTDDKAIRLTVFKLIKNCYKVRSRYYHGKELEKKDTFERIPEYLRDIDNLTREILTRVILNDKEKFLRNTQQMEDWFDELVFQ